MIGVVQYGVGNLFSLCSSLDALGLPSVVTSDEATLQEATHVILPGVGAFGDAVAKLRLTGLFDVIRRLANEGKPLLGICLGMQLLYERSTEYGDHEGLGLLKGHIAPLMQVVSNDQKVPHMGWNSLHLCKATSLYSPENDGSHVYYVHSYYATVSEDTVASSQYGDVHVTGLVAKENVVGMQFHPEKSGSVGLTLLKNFVEQKVSYGNLSSY